MIPFPFVVLVLFPGAAWRIKMPINICICTCLTSLTLAMRNIGIPNTTWIGRYLMIEGNICLMRWQFCNNEGYYHAYRMQGHTIEQ